MVLGGRPRKHEPIADEIRSAIDSGDDNRVRSLIASCDVDVPDGEASTPLIWAAANNRQDLLHWLIAKGANVNHQTRYGYCGLHFAGQNKLAEIASILLGAGAETELRDVYGNTPLWTAGFNARGDFTVFLALLKQGASLENRNNAGRTVRDLAQTLFPAEIDRLISEAS
jgi:ankyrin repeat protein